LKTTLAFTVYLLPLLLAACSGTNGMQTEAMLNTPIAVIQTEPTALPAVETPVTNTIDAEMETLIANPWQWISFTNPVEQFNVENPQNYTLTFDKDGSVKIQADCNNASGSYSVDGSSISIQIGTLTMAACPQGSHSDEFIKYLNSAAIYFSRDRRLFIDLFADGGTMEFAPLGSITAHVGESDDHSPDDLGDILGKLSYSGIFPDQAITFTDGYYYYSEGGSGKPYVRLISPLIRTGDINQDGVEDAVFLLEDNSEGSADFTLLGAVLNVWANPKPVDVVQVEDRIAVKSFSLDGPRVIVEFIGHGQGDVDCCPTLNVRQVFEFKDGRMTQASREELSKASAADLYGTSWRLVDLNGDQEPVLPNSEITLNIEEGQVNGFAGCNHYNGSVTVNQEFPNELTVGPISATQKVCGDPISKQESTYLTRLGTVDRWA
jgi:heat shock protein HslJ